MVTGLPQTACALIWLSYLGACSETPEATLAPLEIETTELPQGRESSLYRAQLEASGAEPPLSWLLEGDLPQDLVFNPAAGSISGIPREGGEFTVQVTALDGAGRQADAELMLTVQARRRTIACGATLSGDLTEAAYVSGGDVDWSVRTGLERLQIPLPADDITRLDVAVDGDVVAYLLEPGKPAGSEDLDDYQRWFGDGRIDLGSSPDLETYHSFDEPLHLLLVATADGDYRVGVACTDGPIFQTLSTLPTRLGDVVDVNYTVFGVNRGVTFAIDGELPDWASFDTATGRITGVSEEVGMWEYLIRATAPDGTTRQEQSGLGVYEPTELPCGTTELEMTTEEPYFGSTELPAASDPRRWLSLGLAVPDDVSAVALDVALPRYGTVVLVDPGSPAWSPWGTLQANTFDGASTVTVEAGARTWPPLGWFDEVVYSTAYAYAYTPLTATMSVRCDRRPQVAHPGLPVFEVGVARDVSVPVIGGQGTITFDHSPLPAGFAWSTEGLLSHDGSAVAGATAVDVTLTDTVGATSTEQTTLWVGDEAACTDGPVLDCGDSTSLSGTGTRETAFFCVTSSAGEYTSVTLDTTVTGDAESTLFLQQPDDIYVSISTATPSSPASETLSDTSRPPLAAYEGHVLSWLVDVRGVGTSSVTVECGPPR